MNYYNFTWWCRWISKTLCWAKKSGHKKEYAVWFHLHKVPGGFQPSMEKAEHGHLWGGCVDCGEEVEVGFCWWNEKMLYLDGACATCVHLSLDWNVYGLYILLYVNYTPIIKKIKKTKIMTGQENKWCKASLKELLNLQRRKLRMVDIKWRSLLGKHICLCLCLSGLKVSIFFFIPPIL